MSSCSCIYVDTGYDSPSLFNSSQPTARIEHTCGECGRSIVPGEKYESARGLWDERWDTHKTCLDCLSVRDEFFCDGYFYEMIWEHFHNHICDVDGHIDGSCLVNLTKPARDKVCDIIEQYWDEGEEI